MERYSEAEKYARECIGKFPDWGTAHTQLARALSGLGRKRDALEAAKEGVRKSPQDAWALAILGYTQKHLKQLSQAATTLRDAIRLDPTYTWSYCMLTEVELDREKIDVAYQTTLDGIVHDPLSENLLRWKAWCEYQLGLNEKAIQTASAALTSFPNSAQLRNVIGCVHWCQAEKQWLRKRIRLHTQAHEYLLEAVRLNPAEEVYRSNMELNLKKCRKYATGWVLALFLILPWIFYIAVIAANPWIEASKDYRGRIILLMALEFVHSAYFSIVLNEHHTLHSQMPLRWLGISEMRIDHRTRRRYIWKFRGLILLYVLCWVFRIIFLP